MNYNLNTGKYEHHLNATHASARELFCILYNKSYSLTLHLKTEAYTRIKELFLSVVYIKVTRMEETAILVPGLVYLMPFYGLLQSVVYKYIVCNTIAISEFIQ